MSAKKLALILGIAFLMSAQIVLAIDEYKPYLHAAKIPDSPIVRLFGQYATSLFPGAATYSYGVDVPKGVNGLQPSVFLSYNSQKVKGRPGMLGAGWTLNQDLVYRDINYTFSDSSDDKFILILDGNMYELVYSGGNYRSEVDYWFRINYTNDYWIVTKQDGTEYRFGYTADSRLSSNQGATYSLKWFLDRVEDTHSNKMFYGYSQNPNPEDIGAVYLSSITYNNDQKRKILFEYEHTPRQDRRRVYEQGNLMEESRRLSSISTYVKDALVARHEIQYLSLTDSLSSVNTLSKYGNDNSSKLYDIEFYYITPIKGYDNQTSSWIPTVSFSESSNLDTGGRLLDANNDGYIDFIKTIENSTHQVWINNKAGNWSLSDSFSTTLDFVDGSGYDQGVRTADINKDGFEDLISAKSNYSRQVYLNNQSNWTLSSWTFPVDFVEGGYDQGVQILDVNADGFADVVKARSGTRLVYLNNHSGWTLSSWSFPVDFVSSGVDQGVRVLDINGDGLPDVLQSINLGSPNTIAWLNNGSGWVSSATWTPPTSVYFTETSKPDAGTRFTDVDGDGLIDILQAYSNGSTIVSKAWLNNGSGWKNDDAWVAPVPFTSNGKNIGVRLGDVTGDGFADIVVSKPDDNRTYVKNSTASYLISAIVNEYGGLTNISYAASTNYNNTNEGISRIGFNVFVVREVLKKNQLSESFQTNGRTNYSYAYGKYDYNKSEFRGFGSSAEQKTSGVVLHYFHQDDARRGKEYETEVYALNSTILSRNVKDYNYTYADGVYNVSLASSTSYLYESSVEPRIFKKQFDYNLFGNPQFTTDYGDLAVAGDEKYLNYSYGFNFDDWIVDKVSRITVLDSEYNKVKETKYYYDGLGLGGIGAKGELTRTENWLDSENNTYSSFYYNTFGGLVMSVDPKGNKNKQVYDWTNTYLLESVNALGHVVKYDYDAGTGNLNWKEENGIRTYFEYDSFGRIIKEIKPYDSSSLPTKRYIYSFDGVAPEKVSVVLKTTGSNSINVSYFYDGFGNLAQVKQDLANGTELVKNIFYDSDYRLGSEQNPYFSANSTDISNASAVAGLTAYSYDALDRVVQVANPDGTSVSVIFGQYNITDFDENGHSHSYTLDGMNRISHVFENVVDAFTGFAASYETSYSYDGNDNLVQIVDNEGNTFEFRYDALSRKTFMSDPDMGNWSYIYDSNNNLIRQTDARGSSISLSYDALNRLTSKLGGEVNVSFQYDKDYLGTLSNLARNADNASYSYDARLRVIGLKMNVSGVLFNESFIYDSQDRLVSDNGLEYFFNPLGKVYSITGYVNNSSYNAFGSKSYRTYLNGNTFMYTYNSANNRLVSIASPNVQNLNYSYDSVGNILVINDTLLGRVHRMSYDYLDRLVTATVGSDSYVFSFNSIGNIKKLIKNNESSQYVYAGSQAHAPSKITTTGVSIDLYEPHELETQSRTRVLEFHLINEQNTTKNATFNISFGDSTVMNGSVNINGSTGLLVLVAKNYSYGGDYQVNFSSTSLGSVGLDTESELIKFGTRASSLQAVYGDSTRRLFQFIIGNDVNETVRNVNWSCSQGITQGVLANISGLGMLLNEIDYVYSLPGSSVFACNVTSLDGNDVISVVVLVKGLTVEDYDVLYTNISRRVMFFAVKNYYNNMSVQVNVSTNGSYSNQSVLVPANDDVLVVYEVNYTSPGVKEFSINLSGNGTGAYYSEDFYLPSASVENYLRVAGNYTGEVLVFDVVNNWVSGFVNWSVNNPSLSQNVNLASGAGVAVVIENNYTVQGLTVVNATVSYSGLVDKVVDYFYVRPLLLFEFEPVLSGNRSVFELVVRNDLSTNQSFLWRLDTGLANITASSAMNVSSQDVVVLVETNYSNGAIYSPLAYVNASGYNDTAQRVVVT